MSSDVSRVMFNESWKEEVDIAIIEASDDASKEFLQFFYRGQVKLTMQTVAADLTKRIVGDKFDGCKFISDRCQSNNLLRWTYFSFRSKNIEKLLNCLRSKVFKINGSKKFLALVLEICHGAVD